MGVNKNQLISFTEQIILILQVISKYGFYNFSQVLRFYAVRKLNNRTSENLLVSWTLPIFSGAIEKQQLTKMCYRWNYL